MGILVAQVCTESRCKHWNGLGGSKIALCAHLSSLALLVWSAFLLVLPQAEGSLDGQSQEGSRWFRGTTEVAGSLDWGLSLWTDILSLKGHTAVGGKQFNRTPWVAAVPILFHCGPVVSCPPRQQLEKEAFSDGKERPGCLETEFEVGKKDAGIKNEGM